MRRPFSKAPANASQTDWKRLDALSDADIDLPETPEVTPEKFAGGVLREGLEPLRRKRTVSGRQRLQ